MEQDKLKKIEDDTFRRALIKLHVEEEDPLELSIADTLNSYELRLQYLGLDLNWLGDSPACACTSTSVLSCNLANSPSHMQPLTCSESDTTLTMRARASSTDQTAGLGSHSPTVYQQEGTNPNSTHHSRLDTGCKCFEIFFLKEVVLPKFSSPCLGMYDVHQYDIS
ncbi:uncharacterized protein LOC135343378 [Halichondria panicea]|uniref:uncharacterized protein LOC135343378 n=1 Tax=Halichondria panicea TaxID=6063 RepID=UPI00312B6C3E